MAKFENFAGKLLRLEGSFVDHPLDKGGPTKYGIILSTWKEFGYDKDGDGDIDVEDIKRLSEADAKSVAKRIFWDYFQADFLLNDSVAEFIVDWGYNSGRKTVAKIIQRMVGVETDGVIGIQSLNAINVTDQEKLFNSLKVERIVFLNGIVKRKPDQIVFYNGWMNRVNSFRFIQSK